MSSSSTRRSARWPRRWPDPWSRATSRQESARFMSAANADTGRHPRWFLAAMAIGLVLRLIVWSQTTSLGTPIVDGQQYWQLARNIAAGHGLAWTPEEPTSIRPPLYPALLATVWKGPGADNYPAVRALQIVLALLTAAVVYRLARQAFDVRVARLAAATVWLY